MMLCTYEDVYEGGAICHVLITQKEKKMCLLLVSKNKFIQINYFKLFCSKVNCILFNSILVIYKLSVYIL